MRNHLSRVTPASSQTRALLWAALLLVITASVIVGQQTPKRPLQSDFGPIEPDPQTRPVSPKPSTQPAATEPEAPYTSGDELIGAAIEHGSNFLLSQFKNGQLASAPELSEAQLQGLDALCVYALAQSGKATGDARLDPKGKTLALLLTRLATYSMAGDGEKTNRPVTYARSLRAAALATFDRPEDRAALKSDVQWLIASQIDGAYSYDDLFVDLMKKGMKPSSSRVGPERLPAPARTPHAASARLLDDGAAATVMLAQDFSGGSPDVGYGGPYSPPAYLAPAPVSPSGPPISGGHQSSSGSQSPATSPPLGSRPPGPPATGVNLPSGYKGLYMVQVPLPPGPLHDAPGGNAVGPKIPRSGVLPPRAVGPGSQRPVPEGAVNPDLRFDFPWDNSNSQYGLLGVWAGAEAGVEVPDAYWKAVEKHWLTTELPTGQWTYRKNDPHPTFAMTCAGVASLLVTHDYLDLPMLKGAVGREPYSKGLALGLAWLDDRDNGVSTPNSSSHYVGYDLFGLERVGLASGFKYFGPHNWYPELASKILSAQFPNGAWGREDHGIDALVDTAYTLLFLSRGRHPVLMTKLKFDKYWANRPRDVANLATFASKQLERQINWQVVGIEHTWDEWFDSPVVFLASHLAPKLADRDFNELQKFTLAGGLIFTHADANSASFDQWVVNDLAKRVAPGGRLVPIPDSDPIYSVLYKTPSHRRLMGVGNGVRWLLVHSPEDLGLAWQMRSDKTRLQDFQMGVNVFLYAAGKPDLRNRLDSPFIPEPLQPPAARIRVARLKFDGNWNPEPAAWPRFSRWLHWHTGRALTLVSCPIESLTPQIAPIATLTGAGAHPFTPGESDALTRFVRSGGVLLIDPCGGETAFNQSIHDRLLPTAFAGAKPVALPADLSLPMKLRPFSRTRHGAQPPEIQLLSLGKGYVVVSPIDMTCALLGTNTWGIDGYEPASAVEFCRNLVLRAGRK